MGCLTVDGKYSGFGLGSLLLADALKRISKAEIAAYALIVEAKDEAAIGFYRHFGFTSFEDATKHLFFSFGESSLIPFSAPYGSGF